MNEENDEMLKIIFQAREESFANLDEADKEFMSKDYANRKKKYQHLKSQLDSIPYNLNKTKEKISKAIENYVEAIDCESSYFTEKYYLNGLKDGIKLMSEVK